MNGFTISSEQLLLTVEGGKDELDDWQYLTGTQGDQLSDDRRRREQIDHIFTLMRENIFPAAI